MIKDNINVWLAVYFADSYGIDLKQMAGFVFLVPVFAFAGRMLYVPVYRVLKNECTISTVSFGVCVLAAAVLVQKRIPAVLALFCFGIISARISMINTHLLSAFPAEFPEQNNMTY